MTQQDIDLQKVQVLESSYQGWFNFRASLIAGGIIAVFILITTIYYEKIIPIFVLYIADIVVIVFSLIIIQDMEKDHVKHIGFISDLIVKIEKGEKLDEVKELRERQKKHKNQKQTMQKLKAEYH